MIYWFNEARNVAEYRAEKAAREKAEQDKKDKQYGDRYYGRNKNRNFVYKTRTDGHEDRYHAYDVGDRNRKDGLVDGSRKYHTADNDDMHRYWNASMVAIRTTKSPKEKNEIRDAVNRNMRRHPERWDGNKPVKPKTESTIFDDVEMI